MQLPFSKPDVAADKTVHRLFPAQIANHIMDGFQLIVRFLIRESRGKGIVHSLIDDQLLALTQLACGRDFKKPFRHDHQVFFDLGLTCLPPCPAQLVELRKPFVGTKAR